MARIKRTTYAEEYSAVEKYAKDFGDNNFCGPVSVALLTGESYEKVAAMMAEEGRKPKQGTYQHITNNVLDKLGFKRTRVDIKAIISSYPKPHCDVLKNMTTHHPRRFPGCIDPNKMYMAHCRGHVLAIAGGVVQDWTINRSLRIYKLEEVTRK